MRKFFVYLLLQYKRALKALPVVILTALVISGCVLLMFVMIGKAGRKRGETEPLRIGVVGDINDKYFSVGLSAMQHLDSSRFAVELIELEETDAMRMIDEGKISGYAVIPEGFVQSVMTGENKQITLVTTNASEDIMTHLVREFMDYISVYLLKTQDSISGLSQYMYVNGHGEDIGKAIDDINLFYVNLVMKRDNLFEPIHYVGSKNTLSANAGYICGLMIFLVMMFGIAYSPVYTRREVSLNAILRIRGLPVAIQVLAEYLSYLGMMYICLLPLITLSVYLIDRSGVLIPEWKMGFLADYGYFITGFIPVIAMFATVQYLLFLLTDNYISGICLQFAFAVIAAYLGGCLYPLSFFPDPVRRSAMFQPAGLSYSYLADILLLKDSRVHLMMILLYLGIFFAAAVAVMKRRLSHEN